MENFDLKHSLGVKDTTYKLSTYFQMCITLIISLVIF